MLENTMSFLPLLDHPLKAVAFAILAVLTWLGWYPIRRWRYRSLPGPFGLPFLGNLPSLASGDATEFLNRCIAKYGNVTKIWFGTRPWVVVAEPSLVRVDFGTTDDDDPGQGGGGQGEAVGGKAGAGAAAQGGDAASAGRALMHACTAVFRCLQLENATVYLPLQLIFPSLRPIIRWLAAHLPDRAQADNMSARSAVASASRRLMEAWQESKAAAAAGAGEAQGPAAGGAGSVFRSVGGGISGSSFMAAMMEGRRGAGREERLSDIEVIAQGFTFLLAGFETTADTLALAAFLLATHPEAAARLQAEVEAMGAGELTAELLAQLPYTDAVLQETLRLYPPLPFLMREAREDVDMGEGRVAPKGSFLALQIHAMHTSPELFPHPDRFMPERWLPEGRAALGPADPHAYAPFGVGARMCVGYKLANMVAKAALVRTFARFDVSLHPRQPLPLRMRTGLSRVPADGVWVSLRDRRAGAPPATALATAAAPPPADS
ncbi:hypothetical protein GPECTOR_4g848 [Gonium pectorale]|uniref:Cytochrome P450 n=1 Tax=Gonium pectorale TaxID=33097 RepID=A0A150GYM3_GONPE|nr:hypothetical protein GPECTOR_4g848 [Gonium pectorale]|eukprot:KXZ54778.1 hypothetical protein GPECTOR_4g848 [Gonium pectorale]